MFTVIIAEKEIIDVYEKYKSFLRPLDNDGIAFCSWNKKGENFENMLPELYDIVSVKNEWRAIILCQDGKEQMNPFDFIQYKEERCSSSKLDWEKMKEHRMKRFFCYEKAVNNPLTKLTSVLCGIPTIDSVIEDDDVYQKIISGEMELYEYMLYRQLSSVNLKNVTAHFKQYYTERLNYFVNKADILKLLGLLEAGDVRGIIDLIGIENVLDFIGLISNQDPFYMDPDYVEYMIENTKKKELFQLLSKQYNMRIKKPEDVICVALRTCDVATYDQNIQWQDRDESHYTRFDEMNLYSEKIKYIIFDILPEDHKQHIKEKIRLLCFLLVMAGNELPYGYIRRRRLYRVYVEFEKDAIRKACDNYITKLKATLVKITDLETALKKERSQKLDEETFEEMSEINVNVPVKMKATLKKDELFAHYKDIGLSTDCPMDEYNFWDDQYHLIKKNFLKYMREPRRAIKIAVKDDFNVKKEVDDDRILLFNDYQKEEIGFRLLEEEQKMIESAPAQLFDTARYSERIEKEDKNLKKVIRQRMTKKKTITIGLAVILAYLIGFLPLIFSNFNLVKIKPFILSVILTIISLVIFIFVGLIDLHVLRKRLVKEFRQFNEIMNSICHEIETGLNAFSEYLGHTSNVIRCFSILNYSKENEKRKFNILKKHRLDINDCICEIREAFSEYISYEDDKVGSVLPYEYDFSIPKDYEYPMPSYGMASNIEYMQKGYYINVPIDYLKTVMLIREDFYD